ncbi:MAG: MarR family transcriptional regulator [Chloroflexi bacterium]|nr:MarR family transcriptional regulator [Chloroflexota bacterium]
MINTGILNIRNPVEKSVMSTAHETALDLLSILPLLNRVMIVELRQEGGEETTMPQFRVLSYLAEAPMTVSDVARRRRVSFQSAGELVQALVERGWITRIPDPNDRRQSLLHLTEAGQQEYERAQNHMMDRISAMVENLSEEDQTIIRRAMSLLQTVLIHEVEQDDRDVSQ